MQEFVQKHKLGRPDFQVIQQPNGSDPDFVMEVSLGNYREEGRGSTKKTAKTSGSWKMYKILMWDICEEEVEDSADTGETSDTATQEVEEVEEELPLHFNYTDLAAFQGTVRCEMISEYGCFDTQRHACELLVNVDELPDLNELDMSQSQIIEEKSDDQPVVSPA